MRVPAAHAYADSAIGTGGRGCAQFPIENMNSAVVFNIAANPACNGLGTATAQVAPGGGGGGYWRAGEPSVILSHPTTCPVDRGTVAAGGRAFTLFPIPAGASHLEHFVVGGSGGGGGSSHAFNSLRSAPSWFVGAGGAGGGGAVGIRSGQRLTISGAGKIMARGGDGASLANQPVTSFSTLGGGGSGGSIVLQSATAVVGDGELNVRGGFGSNLTMNFAVPLSVKGGDGSPGFVRAEMPNNPGVGILRNVVPAVLAQMVGELTDEDARTGLLTTWYPVPLLLDPSYHRYEIEVRQNGATVLYSDDPARGTWARPGDPSVPVWAAFQAALVDARTGLPLDEPRPWRAVVGQHRGQDGMTPDRGSGYRFQLVLNRALAPDLAVLAVRVYFN
jgi:hypothetical protein